MWVLILAIGLSDWVQYARTVRAIVAMEKRKEYVLAARLDRLRALAHRPGAHPPQHDEFRAGDRDHGAGAGHHLGGDALLSSASACRPRSRRSAP